MTSLESSPDKNCMESSLISTAAWKLSICSRRRASTQLKNYFAIGILTSQGPRFTPKRTSSRTGYVEGATLTRLKELNPSSRDTYCMDPANISWLETETTDSYWEAYHRRSDSEGDWDGSSDDVPPDLDDQEDAWNDSRRRERVDEAIYDC